MTLRDLTEKQRKKFLRKCSDDFKMRNKGRNIELDEFSYRTGFSDGVRAVLEHVDKLV
jgi:hypothetical protein